MSCVTECCVFTRGEFYISDTCNTYGGCEDGLDGIFCGVQNSFLKVGNVSSCQVEIQSQVLGKENMYNRTTNICSRQQIISVDMQITFNCSSRNNLARALFSAGFETFVDPVSDTALDVFVISEAIECDFFPFSKKLATQATVVVGLYDAMGTLLQTLVEDEDYQYSKSGIQIIKEIDLPYATTVKISYSYNTENYNEIDFNSKIPGYKTLYFKGINYGEDEAKMFDATFHKVLFGPISQFDLITKDDFLTLTLSGSVEKDSGSWFKIIKQEG